MFNNTGNKWSKYRQIAMQRLGLSNVLSFNLHPPKLFTNVVSQVGAKKTPFLKRLSNRYFSRYLPNSFFVVLSNFLATISILYFVDRFIWIYVFLSVFGLEMMTKYVKHEISWKILVIDQIGYHNRILRTKIHKYTSF